MTVAAIVLLYFLRATCLIAAAIAFAAVITMGLYGFLKHFGYFKRIPPFEGENVRGDET